MFEKIQKLRETKGKEKESLHLINQTIINLLWEKALTYQHVYRHNGGDKKVLVGMVESVSTARSYIDKYKIRESLPMYYLFLGKINDFKGKFNESVKCYKKAPKTAEVEGHMAYSLIMSGKTNLGFKKAVKALKDIDYEKVYTDLKKKDYYTWAVWKSGIVVRVSAALIVKKVKFDRELVNKWIGICEKELKNGDFGYRRDELGKLKQKLKVLGF